MRQWRIQNSPIVQLDTTSTHNKIFNQKGKNGQSVQWRIETFRLGGWGRQNIFFRPFRPQSGLRIKGGGGLGPQAPFPGSVSSISINYIFRENCVVTKGTTLSSRPLTSSFCTISYTISTVCVVRVTYYFLVNGFSDAKNCKTSWYSLL